MQQQQTTRREESPSATELVKDAGADAAALVKTELALARRELADNLRAARASAVALGGAAVLGLAGMELVTCLGGAVALGQLARREMPELLERTRRRAAEDTTQITESLR